MAAWYSSLPAWLGNIDPDYVQLVTIFFKKRRKVFLNDLVTMRAGGRIEQHRMNNGPWRLRKRVRRGNQGEKYKKGRQDEKGSSHFLLRVSYQPTRTPVRTSKSGTYGLMSSRGVLSNTSTPSIVRMFSFRNSKRTIEIPIGFGRHG